MPEGDTIFRVAAALHRALAGRIVTRFESVYPAVTRIAVPSNSTARSAIDERSRSASSVAPASGVCGSKITISSPP